MKSKKILFNTITLLIYTFAKIILNFLLVRLIIKSYGSTINGFNSTILSILNYLNLIEAGVGSATIFALYKPIIEKDKNRINAILSFTNLFFKKVALIMFIILIFIALTYPWLVKDFTDKILGTYIIIVYSIITVSDYIYDSKYRLLFNADQKLYLVNITSMVSYIVSRIASIIMCILQVNFYLTISMLFLEMLIRMIFTYRYKHKYYSWINLAVIPDKSIWKNSKNVFIQKVANLIFNSTDILLITTFIGAKQTSVYAVYNLVYNGLANLMRILENSPLASIGQLFAESNKLEEAKKNYHHYEFFCMMITTIFGCCWNLLIVPFIKIYTKGVTDINYIEYGISILMGLYFLLTYYRMPHAVLINAPGRFKKVKNVYLTEAIINIVTSIILLFLFGTTGVILGSIIALLYSTYSIIKIVYEDVLQEQRSSLYKKMFLNFSLVLLSILLGLWINVKMENLLFFILYAGILFIITVIIVYMVNYIFYKKQVSENVKKIRTIIQSIKSNQKDKV